MLVVAVFLASAVETVEALTIVLAVGLTRGWRSALEGVAVALVALAALVAVLGPALVHLVPLSILRLVVGGLLLVFGLQWLRKAVLRASGLKAKHDEDAIFAEQVAELSVSPPAGAGTPPASSWPSRGCSSRAWRWWSIVLTLGAASHDLGLATAAAGRGTGRGRGRRPAGRPPALVGARERHEDGGRPDAGQLRHLLGG